MITEASTITGQLSALLGLGGGDLFEDRLSVLFAHRGSPRQASRHPIESGLAAGVDCSGVQNLEQVGL
jgi:hypothetical protein